MKIITLRCVGRAADIEEKAAICGNVDLRCAQCVPLHTLRHVRACEVGTGGGRCRGAASGEGLGNAFLSHITGVDGIFHVCRGFEVRPRLLALPDAAAAGSRKG